MGDDADRLQAILAGFAHDPDDAALWAEAREFADRFTMDQLCTMAASRADEVRRMFDRILGRAVRRERDDARRASGVGDKAPTWSAPRSRRGAAGGTR